MIKKLLIVIMMFIFSFITYSASIIFQAKKYTEEVVLRDFQSNRWRIYDGKNYPIKIKHPDFSRSKLDWLIAVQDPGFYKHNGMDITTPGAGYTTITQAITKRSYFKNFKPGFNKIKLILIAVFVVDKMLSKKEQLELFINSAYMGTFNNRAIYGFYDAAKVYHQKEFAALSGDEYLSLVAMLIAPDSFNVRTNPKKNLERVSRIKLVILGEYVPKELTDVYYEH